LVSLVRQRPELTLVPPAALKLNLAAVGDAGSAAGKPRPSPGPPAAAAHSRKGTARGGAAPSWGVARAKEGAVKPGFSKAELTRVQADDPRAPGGVFERVGGLLSDLLDRG